MGVLVICVRCIGLVHVGRLFRGSLESLAHCGQNNELHVCICYGHAETSSLQRKMGQLVLLRFLDFRAGLKIFGVGSKS